MDKYEDAINYINDLPETERQVALSYILEKLLGQQLAQGQIITLSNNDGSVLGVISPPTPPSKENSSIMRERVQRVRPGSGQSPREMLEKMKNNDETGVKKYLKGI